MILQLHLNKKSYLSKLNLLNQWISEIFMAHLSENSKKLIRSNIKINSFDEFHNLSSTK